MSILILFRLLQLRSSSYLSHFYLGYYLINENLVTGVSLKQRWCLTLFQPLHTSQPAFIVLIAAALWNATLVFSNVFPLVVYFSAGLLRKLNSYLMVHK